MFLVAPLTWRDLLLCAKHLFVATICGSSLYSGPQSAACRARLAGGDFSALGHAEGAVIMGARSLVLRSSGAEHFFLGVDF